MKLKVLLASALVATVSVAAPASANQLSNSLQVDGVQLTLPELAQLKRFRDQDEHARANFLIKRAKTRDVASRNKSFTSGKNRSRQAELFDLRVALEANDHARARFLQKRLRNN